MPLTDNDFQTGDIIMCYGWNLVAGGQATLKTFNRLTVGALKTAREVVTALPKAAYHGLVQRRMPRLPVVMELGDPVGIGAGSAKANHALIVGPPVQVTRANMRDETDDEMGRRRADLEEAAARQKGKMAEQIRRQIQGMTRERKPGLKAVLTVCHSTGNGFLRSALDNYLGAHAGAIALFRMEAGGGDAVYRLDAGQVGERWAPILMGEGNDPPREPGEPTNYSKLKAFFSAFGSHAFGPGAAKRAAGYRAHRGTPGGPPAEKSSDAHPKKKGFFCSMFVIACYHAAFPNDEFRKRYMPLDAKYTTPMTLDGYLRTNGSPWRSVGAIP